MAALGRECKYSSQINSKIARVSRTIDRVEEVTVKAASTVVTMIILIIIMVMIMIVIVI